MKPAMTHAEFALIADSLRLRANPRRVAGAYLTGEAATLEDAAALGNPPVSATAVHKTVQRVLAERVPDGWERVCVTVPAALAKRIRALAVKAAPQG